MITDKMARFIKPVVYAVPTACGLLGLYVRHGIGPVITVLCLAVLPIVFIDVCVGFEEWQIERGIADIQRSLDEKRGMICH